MPDVKISALPTATTIADADILVVNQGSPAVTKKISYGTLLPVAATNTGTFGNDHEVAQVTIDSKGRTTAAASVPINASNISVGTLPVDHGGTGAATHTAGAYLKGNGTAAITTAATVPVADIAGTLPVAKGGTGAATLTGFVKASGTNAMTASATVALGSEVSGTLPVANGGTGAATLTASGYLKGNGTSAITSQTGVPAADITGTLGIPAGGTGQTTQQAALNALAGAATNAQYLRGNGTNVVMSALQAADLSGTISSSNLADTGVSATSYGSSTQVGTFTVDSKGRLTTAASVAISASGIGAITTTTGGTISSAGITGTALAINCPNSLFGITSTTTIASPTLFASSDNLTGTTITTNGVSLKASAGITFGSSGTQTVPYIAPLKFSTTLGILGLNPGATMSITITGSGLLKTYPVLVAINQTSNIPNYLLLTAYCSNSTTISVTIRNSSSATTANFDSGATIEATVFR